MVHVSVRMAWISFSALPLRGGEGEWVGLDDTSRLDVVEIVRVACIFILCNKKRLAIRHMNRPVFLTTLSIPSNDIGK
jgi:hypothetical protein